MPASHAGLLGQFVRTWSVPSQTEQTWAKVHGLNLHAVPPSCAKHMGLLSDVLVVPLPLPLPPGGPSPVPPLRSASGFLPPLPPHLPPGGAFGGLSAVRGRPPC